MLWDLYQELEIRQTKAVARMAEEGATSRVARAQEHVERIEDRFEKLLMLTEAVWELAAPSLGLTEEHLIAKIREIDARSGAIDGRRAIVVRRCSQCQAAIEKGRATCAFCGHAEPGLVAFDQV
jgi:hypothetical protein